MVIVFKFKEGINAELAYEKLYVKMAEANGVNPRFNPIYSDPNHPGNLKTGEYAFSLLGIGTIDPPAWAIQILNDSGDVDMRSLRKWTGDSSSADGGSSSGTRG